MNLRLKTLALLFLIGLGSHPSLGLICQVNQYTGPLIECPRMGPAPNTCLNDPVNKVDPLGLYWWESIHDKYNKLSAWRVGDGGVPEVRRLNGDQEHWQAADSDELAWFFTRVGSQWSPASRADASQRFIGAAQATLQGGKELVERYVALQSSAIMTAPIAGTAGLAGYAEEMLWNETVGINPRNIPAMMKSGWRKASELLDRVEFPLGQANMGVPWPRLNPKVSERTITLQHGSTAKRVRSIYERGPQSSFVEPGGGAPAGGFSTARAEGPFPLGSPQQYAQGKADIFPAEGGPAVLELLVPESIVKKAIRVDGEIRFESGYGLEDLLDYWQNIHKRIK